MAFKRGVCLVLLVVLAAVLVQPARAEALEPMTILLIAGAGIAVIALIAVLVIANVTEKRPRTSQAASELMMVLAAPPFVTIETVEAVGVPMRESP